jgi:hypothetical protein
VISEKHSCGSRFQALQDLAHRPHRAPDEEKLPFDAMYLLDRVGSGALEHLVLQVLEPVSEQLEDREDVVDHRVDQRVGGPRAHPR